MCTSIYQTMRAAVLCRFLHHPFCVKVCSISTLNFERRAAFSYSRKKSRVEPLYYRAQNYLDRVAIVDQHATHYYRDLFHRSNVLTEMICDQLGASNTDNIDEKRVTFLCPNDVSYVSAQWGIWGAGGVAVPLSNSHPASELEYFIEDTNSCLVVATEDYAERVEPISKKLGKLNMLLLLLFHCLNFET